MREMEPPIFNDETKTKIDDNVAVCFHLYLFLFSFISQIEEKNLESEIQSNDFATCKISFKIVSLPREHFIPDSKMQQGDKS